MDLSSTLSSSDADDVHQEGSDRIKCCMEALKQFEMEDPATSEDSTKERFIQFKSDFQEASEVDLLRVHDEAYIGFLKSICGDQDVTKLASSSPSSPQFPSGRTHGLSPLLTRALHPQMYAKMYSGDGIDTRPSMTRFNGHSYAGMSSLTKD
jgi:acetoin utilization deacetylase AcuC-like enzyme